MQLSVKMSLAVHCLIFISEYGEKNKVVSDMLAVSSGANPVVIRGILSSLKKAGIINVKSGTGGATLAKKPEEITAGMIWGAIRPKSCCVMGFSKHTNPSQTCPVGQNINGVLNKTYSKIINEFEKSLNSVTFADILADYHRRLKENGETADI